MVLRKCATIGALSIAAAVGSLEFSRAPMQGEPMPKMRQGKQARERKRAKAAKAAKRAARRRLK